MKRSALGNSFVSFGLGSFGALGFLLVSLGVMPMPLRSLKAEQHGTSDKALPKKNELKDRITPQVTISSNNQKQCLKWYGEGRKHKGDGGGSKI